MKNRIYIAAAVLLLLCVLGFTYQSKSQVWEYHVEFYGSISEKKLNELAAQGWELVATSHQSDVNEFIFRRPK